MMTRTTLVVLIALALSAGRMGGGEDTIHDGAPPVPGTRSANDATEAPATDGENARAVRWIAVGGGAEPSSTEVSLEQDVGLARRVLGDGGRVLFGGGKGAASVRVLRQRRVSTLFLRVADLLDPRQGRDSNYRRPLIEVDGAATREATLASLDAALRAAGPPLLVYFATHGDKGEKARANGVQLWGDSLLTVADLAEAIEAAGATREVRLVVTACYGGGFADLAFAGADAEKGLPAATPRCGLFASQWDELSSGCDPDPDRRAQESYGIHFLNALRGRDRSNQPLAPGDVDFDSDGRISLLEAHTRARIASRSMGVPTSTSERWLRHAAPKDGPRRAVALPEEEALIAGLSRRLQLADEKAARVRLRELKKQMKGTDDRLGEIEDEEAERLARLRVTMLGRWPVLDDPWHPAFPVTFARNRGAIRRFLTRSRVAADYGAARRELDRWQTHFDRLRLRESSLRRLVRAYDTLELASRLSAVGGPAWEHYERLLACERGGP
jgi:hypothetical protein